MTIFGKNIPSYKQRPHLWKKWIWVALSIPTVLWWYDSILWVLIISLATQIETADGADEAQLAKEKEKKNE